MKSNNTVIVTSGQGPFDNAKNALSALNLDFIRGKKVLIKPNAGRAVPQETGINTHPQAIAGVIEVLLEKEAGKIAIGESPILGVKTLEAFEIAGIKEIAEKYNVELHDMDSIPPVVKKIKNGRILESTKVCAHVYQYDLILSLPVAKCHMHTGVTLGIKNLKGCLYKREKVRYHQLEYKEKDKYKELTLNSAISDLATILLPDITVVDGYIGMQGLGPSGGEIIKSNFAVASTNPIGADITACKMMGIDPESIEHLKIISERLNFSINPDDYNILPENYEDYKVTFKKPNTNIQVEYPDVVLYDKESCSACLSTVMFFLKRFNSDMSQYLLNDNKLHLAIGKGIDYDKIKEGTILIGNCARQTSGNCKFVPGCPPVASQIYKTITGNDPEKNEP